MVVGSSPTPGAMTINNEFDTIISAAYEESGTLDRQISDVLSVTRVPELAKPSVMYLADFVSCMPGMEIWMVDGVGLNSELTELFEPWAFPEASWREAVAVGSEFGILRARMLGCGTMVSVEVRPNFVSFCVENGEFVNAILAAIAFNEAYMAEGDPELAAYETAHVASLGVFGGWRELAFACIAHCVNWGDVAVNMVPVMSKCCEKFDLGELEDHPWLVNGNAVWSILRDTGLFSGDVRTARLCPESALNLCLLSGNFSLGEKISRSFDV
jgi:hypothetical protein